MIGFFHTRFLTLSLQILSDIQLLCLFRFNDFDKKFLMLFELGLHLNSLVNIFNQEALQTVFSLRISLIDWLLQIILLFCAKIYFFICWKLGMRKYRIKSYFLLDLNYGYALGEFSGAKNVVEARRGYDWPSSSGKCLADDHLLAGRVLYGIWSPHPKGEGECGNAWPRDSCHMSRGHKRGE